MLTPSLRLRPHHLLSLVSLLILISLAPAAALDGDPPLPLITNVFQDYDLRAALQDVAAQAGVSIIADVSVGGRVSLDLPGTPLEQALAMLLAGGGYTFKQIAPNCYLVGTGDPKQPTFNLLSETAVIPLNHITAQRVTDLLLSEFYAPYVKVHAQDSLVVVTGPPALVSRVREDLAKIDQPKPQVLIEALITDISCTGEKDLGVNWRVTSGVEEPQGVQVISFAGMTLGYASLRMREVLLSLKALFEAGHARTRANPCIMALDGEAAEIFVGREEYFSLLAGGTVTNPYYRLEPIKSGITLKVLPRVLAGDEILLEISPEVSDVAGVGADDLPVINRRTVHTKVRLKDGETVVIGGLAAEFQRRSRTGVPILKDLPLLGALFSSRTETTLQSEVHVLITPRIVRSATPVGVVPSSRVSPGDQPHTEDSDPDS